MNALGMRPTEAQIADIIKEIDIDHDGTIDFEEFCILMAKPGLAHGGANTGEGGAQDGDDPELRQAFGVFDKDGSGKISIGELGEVMQKLGVLVLFSCLSFLISLQQANT